MGFSKKEYHSGLSFSSPEDLPDPGIKPGSPVLQAGSLLSELQGSPLQGRLCIIGIFTYGARDKGVRVET